MEAIIQMAKTGNETEAFEDLKTNKVGEEQTHFLGQLEKEIEKAADFYSSLNRKSIADCNQILKDRD